MTIYISLSVSLTLYIYIYIYIYIWRERYICIHINIYIYIYIYIYIERERYNTHSSECRVCCIVVARRRPHSRIHGSGEEGGGVPPIRKVINCNLTRTYCTRISILMILTVT